MLISKIAKAKISYANVTYYRNLGYICKKGDILDVPIEQLSSGSHALVKVRCDYCGKESSICYKSLKEKFACSKECIDKEKKETCMKNYGVEWSMQSKVIQDKSKETREKKYGDRNYNNRKKASETCISRYECDNPAKYDPYIKKSKKTRFDKYGQYQSHNQNEKNKRTCKDLYDNETYNNREKATETCLERYNCINPAQNNEIKDKIKNTFLQNYGVDSPMKDPEVVKKQRRTFITNFLNNKYHPRTLYFKDTKIYYQSKYELDFLERYYTKYSDLKRGPIIRYTLNNKSYLYFSDFYIPSLNLIIEIKSSYTFELHKEKNLAKEQECLKQGFNFMFILDCQYDKFELLRS